MVRTTLILHLATHSLTNVGLLARGLSAIAPRGGLEGWRWIFIIEGLLVSNHTQSEILAPSLLDADRGCLMIKTIVAGLVAFVFLPSSIATASYLTPEEKEVATQRLEGRIPSTAERFKYIRRSYPVRLSDHKLTLYSAALEREERFKWSEVYRGIFNLQVWLSATAYFSILSGLYSFGLFVGVIFVTPLLPTDESPR